VSDPGHRALEVERRIAAAAAVIAGGGVVAFPTESSYGLAVDATSSAAVDRLFALKGRPPDKAVPVVIAGRQQLDQLVDLPLPAPVAHLAGRHWPGALSLVLPARAGLPPLLLAGGTTVAVRVPAHAWARRLCAASGCPLTATSANHSGEPPALDAAEVRRQLGDQVHILDGGRLPGGPPSTLVEVIGGQLHVHRQGAVVLGPDDQP
jgi:L-threonylcarbamoyladenylate synthase